MYALIFILLYVTSSFLFTIRASPSSNATLGDSWRFTSSVDDDGIALRNLEMASGFSQLHSPSGLAFFSVYMLGATPGSVGQIGNGPASRLGHIIWTANRDRPVSLNATLELQGDGNLVLKDADGTLVWESETSQVNVTGMELSESGNLVLFNEKKEAVWESFRSPSEALGFSQKLGVGERLVSSFSARNVSGGHFYLEVEQRKVSLRHRSGGEYGKWCERQRSQMDISFILLENGFLRCYDVNNTVADSITLPKVEKSFLSYQFVEILPDGDVRHIISSADVEIDVHDAISLAHFFVEQNSPCGVKPAACGTYGLCTNNGDCACPTPYLSPVDGNDLKLGCLLDQPPGDCRNNNMTEMVEFPGMKMTLADQAVSWNISLEDCRALCSTNCSCMGLVYTSFPARINCFHIPEVLTLWNATLYDEATSVTFLKMAPSAPPPVPSPDVRDGTRLRPPRKRKQWSTVYIVAAIILATGILLLLVLWKFYHTQVFSDGNSKRRKSNEKEVHVLATPNTPKYFEYEELCKITDNFSNKLGVGGFSVVFGGVCEDGHKVAVKRMDSARHGVKQFEAEVKTIGSIHHRNLVSLQGYGVDECHHYLVYEFVENMSLDRWIFREKQENERVLNWKQRLSIATDIARGLHYLHEGCKERVLHLDIKPQNILLETNFDAKICDFGLARLVDAEKGSVNTVHMRGTPGYMAPEWLHARVSDKTDVYSFGIVLLELVSGRKTVGVPWSHWSCRTSVLEAKVFEDTGTLAEVVDPRLVFLQGEESLNVKQLEKVSEIGVLCTQSDPLQRPSTGTVLKMLEELKMI